MNKIDLATLGSHRQDPEYRSKKIVPDYHKTQSHTCRFSVNKSGNEYQGSFYFLVDEVRYANKDVYVGSDVHPSGSATINVELRAGQIVRIENYGSTVIFGSDDGVMYSWFTGHLLYAL